jgi:CRP-like cAMP-binding protein
MIDPALRIAQATQPYLFQNSFILNNLPVEDLKMLEENIISEVGKRGDVLFRQGAFPNGVYWLISGKIKILQETPTGQKQTMYIYSDGDLVAYRQFIAEEPHPVTAVLVEDSTYRFIPSELFRWLLATSPFFSRNILTALAREFTVWMNRMTVFSQYPVRYRLILALLILHEQYRMSGSEPGVVTMTRTDLAEFVGAKLETVVRVLNTLKSAGLVSINGRRILLPDTIGLLDVLQIEEV